MRPTSLIALCVSALDGAADEVQLLPAGKFRAWDGRPKGIPAWRIDAVIAKRVIEAFVAHGRPLVIDYEHQSLNTQANGQPAPAAGWIESMEWRDADATGAKGGLYARVTWTDRARTMIAAGEYRYLSPVFGYEKSGAVLTILNAALTNNPALDQLDAVELRAAASRLLDPHQENVMSELLKKLLASLGLPETTEEAAALSAVAALKASSEALTTEVAALKAATPDPEKFVSVATMTALQGQVAALTAQINLGKVDAIVKDALAAAKLLPAQEAWARDLGAKDLAALTRFVESAQPIAALSGTQTGGGEPSGGAGGVDLANAQSIETAALKYMRERKADGVEISIAQAVAHVTKR